ncbi:AAA family ATPase [Mucilaginibacter rubeus]|uniref:AAA family ATPase n=1 Tax=Mucilaginibacter rubeus TaxID=2027860 RepID=A0A5C1HYU1_9SPHI|nr:AAA family ATPase [Mucilaginibacter rubeus]QEM11022.1 AAA family ATPase [Mucilaginibacter rubeus]
MEAVIFCGIQATGKTTFFKERFFKTHIRISLDQLNTRNKELRFIETCISTSHPFVVDNTNPTQKERAKYIAIAKANKFKVTGYYFQSKLVDALERNNQRSGKEKIPEIGIRGTFKRLALPSADEGFDELFYVTTENNTFTIKAWSNEI